MGLSLLSGGFLGVGASGLLDAVNGIDQLAGSNGRQHKTAQSSYEREADIGIYPASGTKSAHRTATGTNTKSDLESDKSDQSELMQQLASALATLVNVLRTMKHDPMPEDSYGDPTDTGGIQQVGSRRTIHGKKRKGGVPSGSFKGAFDPSSSGFSKKAPTGPLSPEERNKLGAQVMVNLMKDLKLTPKQAAGVAGNLMHESAGMNSNINEIGKGSEGGFGWAQWTGSRRTAFMNYARAHGLEPGSPAANYGFLVHELKPSKERGASEAHAGSEARALKLLKQETTVEGAALSFSNNYERPGVPHNDERVRHAEALYAAYLAHGSKNTVA